MDIAEYIVKTVPHGPMLFVFTSGVVCTAFYNLIIKIYNMFDNKIKSYEEIIAKYLNTCDVECNKEKKLITNAKENTDKRFKRKQKLDKIFKKIK